MPTDPTIEDAAGASSGAQDTTDYKAKYTGLNSAHSKVLARLAALEEKAAKEAADYESEIANLKSKAKPETRRVQELEDQLRTATTERDTFKGELTAREQEKATRALIKEKFTGLLDDWDDDLLRPRSMFKDDAAFEAYLAKAAGKKPAVSTPEPEADPDTDEAPKPEGGLVKNILGETRNTMLDEKRPKGLNALGATPSVGANAREGTGKARSLSQIQKDMDALDYRAKDYRQKMDVYTKELDAALG